MEMLILILIIIIIILICTCIHLFEVSKKEQEKTVEYARNCNLAEQDRDHAIAECEILDKELKLLKEQEIEKLKKEPIIMNNKKIKMKKTFKGKKVLVGDYNIEMLNHSRKIFLSLGFEVDTVQSGDDMIEKVINENTYDVIVTNNMYKNSCDGIDVLHTLKERETFSTPIVVLTVSTGQKEKFLYQGFDGYLEKMLTQEQAEEVMTELLFE